MGYFFTKMFFRIQFNRNWIEIFFGTQKKHNANWNNNKNKIKIWK